MHASIAHHSFALAQAKLAEKAPETPVLTTQWLHECIDLGKFVDPKPRHRLYVPYGATAPRIEGCDTFGDSLTETAASNEDALADVAALLRTARRRREDMAHWETSISLFRGVIAFVISGGGLTASLREFDHRQVQSLIKGHGGDVSLDPDDTVTHVVIAGSGTLLEAASGLAEDRRTRLMQCMRKARPPHVVDGEWVRCAIRDLKMPSEGMRKRQRCV